MSVLSHLRQRAGDAVLSATEKSSITTSINTLQTRLEAHFNTGQLGSHFKFGSQPRETILPRSMDSHSDVDYMVVFVESGYAPQTYLDRLRKFVETKYSTSEISQSSPTIVLELNHIRFELVPALKAPYGTGYQIPDGPSAWQATDPTEFNSKLIAKNQSESYYIKPVVRLAKYWNANQGYVFASYSLEKWIVDRFYWSCNNERDYLFNVIDGLSSPDSTQWRKQAIDRAKQIITNVKKYEADDMPFSAEAEVKKLIPT